jgi:hypothetical protein
VKIVLKASRGRTLHGARSGEGDGVTVQHLLGCIAKVHGKDAERTRFALIECAALDQANGFLKRR